MTCTPLQHDLRLSETYGSEVYLKREDLQVVRSYKLRGAFNKISELLDEGPLDKVVCASAGNHAQGVAWSCQRLSVSAEIFMPVTTPNQKIEQVRLFGGTFVNLHLVGDTFDDALAAAQQFCEAHQVPFIPPFDDDAIIAGQATVGLEFLEQSDTPPDYVIVPVGGGGLAAGIAKVLAELSPTTHLITVEPEGAPSLQQAILNGRPVRLDKIDRFVDGAAVKAVGTRNFEVLKHRVHQHLTIPEGSICTTLLDMYNKNGFVLEPAGALSIAALSYLKKELKGKRVICVVSGGNNDITRMEEIKERSLLHEGLKHYFMVRFPQRAGALKSFVSEVLTSGEDIAHFEYTKRNSRDKASAVVGIELPQNAKKEAMMARMKAFGYDTIYLNDQPQLFEFLV